jgi:uncharacterized delta-60 repeat protein
MLPVWLRSMVNPSRYPLPRSRRGLKRPTAGRSRPQLESLESRVVLNGGLLDPTFGTKGLVKSSLLYHASDATTTGVHTAALEPINSAVSLSGDIVIAGVSAAGTTQFTVGIFSPQGALINVFTAPHFSAGSTDIPYAVAVQPTDGKIVVVGSTLANGATRTHFAIARFNTNGTMDGSFGNFQNSGVGQAGEVTIDFSSPNVPSNDLASCVAIDAAGRIVVGGTNTGTFTFNGASTPFGNLCVARLNPDGTVDSDFDADGKVQVNMGLTFSSGAYVTVDGLTDVAVQSDGKVVAVGWTNTRNDFKGIDLANNFAIVRFNEDGTLDKTFKGGGIAAALALSPYGATGFDQFEDRAYSVAIQGDNKIVVSGLTQYQTVGDLTPAQYNFATIRLNTDGSFDFGFTPDGTVVTDFAADFTNGSEDVASDVSIQSDGKILVTGFTATKINGTIGTDMNIAMVRYNTDGTLDQNFGASVASQPAPALEGEGHGKVVIDVGTVLGTPSVDDWGDQALPLPNGQVLLVGATGDNPNATLVLSRLTGFQAGTVQFGSATYAVNENGGQITINVTRVGGTSGTATVNYATTTGTAVAGTDYVPTSGTLIFAPGATQATFTVTVKDDNIYQTFNKKLNLALSNLAGGPTFGTPTVATLTIVETDQPGSGGSGGGGGGGGGGGPPSTANFIASVYQDLVKRAVDPAGLTAWTNFINGGGSRSQMVFDVEQSQEYRTIVIENAYSQYLHRAADPSGLSSFLNYMASGGTDEQVAELLISSSEFFQTQGGGSNDGFLTALYADALNRGVDAPSRSAWDQYLAGGGTTLQVAASILNSTEYRTDLINGWYTNYLKRPVDSGGLNYFLGLFQNGLQGPTNIFNPGGGSVTKVTDELVIAMIMGSNEFYLLT